MITVEHPSGKQLYMYDKFRAPFSDKESAQNAAAFLARAYPESHVYVAQLVSCTQVTTPVSVVELL